MFSMATMPARSADAQLNYRNPETQHKHAHAAREHGTQPNRERCLAAQPKPVQARRVNEAISRNRRSLTLRFGLVCQLRTPGA